MKEEFITGRCCSLDAATDSSSSSLVMICGRNNRRGPLWISGTSMTDSGGYEAWSSLDSTPTTVHSGVGVVGMRVLY